MFSIDFKSGKPIYEQITAEIKVMVIKGFLKPMDSLPSVRKMAIMLNVNPNTVAKAYHELERENVISTIRGKGAFINNIKTEERKDAANIGGKMKEAVMELRFLGFNEEEVAEEARKAYREITGREDIKGD